ncbi:MAG TPA: PIN domain-containing protein [Bryobacteraceae bacterium]|nr:PIN domain-containing protein [Bryobacteraceae bacterium]
MSRIYWDTVLFAYWLEDRREYAPRLQQIFEKMTERGDTLCTSAYTVGELLLGPRKVGALDVVQQIRDFFRTPAMRVLPFTEETGERYARIRVEQQVSAADAIHLATAAQANVDVFLTADRRLLGLMVPGIQFIAGMDVNLF